jgi:uncharacterized membrane protein HdeD (DUF308 family)
MPEVEAVETHSTWDSAVVFRVIAAAAGAAMLLIGLVALVQINWDAGFDAAPVDVMGMAFTPQVAIGTAVAGLIALIAGATPDRETKLIVGGLLVVAGIAIVVANVGDRRLQLEDGHGWLAIIIGAVLVVVALVMQSFVRTRRVREYDATRF